MAFLGADTFDHNDLVSTGWYNIQNAIGTTTDSPFGEGRSLGPLGNATYNRRQVGSNEGTFWIYFHYFSGGSSEGFWLGDSSVAQVGVQFNPATGQVFVRTSGGTGLPNFSGAVIASATGIFTINQWNHFAFRFVIHNTTGSVAMYHNGGPTPVFNVSNVNTRGGTANNFINEITIGSTGGAGNARFDNMLWHNEAGTDFNTYLGDLRGSTRAAAGAGNSTQFPTRVGGSGTNWSANSQVPSDGDTSYVESNTVGHQDLYTVTSLGYTPVTIVGVKPFIYLRKPDAGARTAALRLRSNTTETNVRTTASVPVSYGRFESMLPTDPATGSAWNLTAVNALQVGPRVEA